MYKVITAFFFFLQDLFENNNNNNNNNNNSHNNNYTTLRKSMSIRKSLTEAQHLLRDAIIEKSNRPLLDDISKLQLEQYLMHESLLTRQKRNLLISKELAMQLINIYEKYMDMAEELFSIISDFQNSCCAIPNLLDECNPYCNFDPSGNVFDDPSGNICGDPSGNLFGDPSGDNNVICRPRDCNFTDCEKEKLDEIYHLSIKLIEFQQHQSFYNKPLFYKQPNSRNNYCDKFEFSADQSTVHDTKTLGSSSSTETVANAKKVFRIRYGNACNKELQIITKWTVSNPAINELSEDPEESILEILYAPFSLETYCGSEIPNYLYTYLLSLHSQIQRVKSFQSEVRSELTRINIIEESTESNLSIVHNLISQLSDIDMDGLKLAIEETEETKKVLSSLPSSVSTASSSVNYFTTVVRPIVMDHKRK